MDKYCNNCGNEGHYYRECRYPILSYGIILYDDTEKDNIKLQGELKSIEDFLSSTSIPDKKSAVTIPEVKANLQQEIGILQQEIKNYNDICKKIDKNNYKQLISR